MKPVNGENSNMVRKNGSTLMFVTILIASIGDAIAKTPQTHILFVWIIG